MGLGFEEMKRIIELVARKYHEKAHMEFEDLCQDLWIFAYEKEFDSAPIAYTCMKNKCIDISRRNWKKDNMTDGSDPDIAFATVGNNGFDLDQNILVEEMLSTLGEREYKYAVAVAYLSGCIQFEKKFFEIYNSLSDDSKFAIKIWRSSGKRNTDDIVFKAVIGLKGGSNSSSSRVIKWNIYDSFRKFGFRNSQYESRKNNGRGYDDSTEFSY